MKSSNTKSFYSDFLPAFASGAVASAIAKTAIAPLDRTKINFQVSRSQKYSFTAALKFAKKTYRESGFFSLWRGNSAQIVRVVPSGAIQFAAHEQYVELFQVDKNGVSTPFRRFAAGSCATTTAGIITYPLDTARAQLAVSSKDEYKNLTSVFVQNYRNHGLSSFYRGLIPSLMGAMIYGGVGWFINDSLKKMYKERTGLKVTLVTSFVFGASAGLIGQVCSYPLDIVRRRTQTRRIPPGQTTAQSLMLIWRTKGVRDGLYKGFSINMIEGPLSSGIWFATSTLLLRMWKEGHNK